MLFWIIILVVLIVLLVLYYKRSKKFRFDSIVMLNGGVGSGKTSCNIWFALKSHKKAHGIWWRRVHIYSILKPKLKYEEEPLLYSNIPIYENFKKNILYKYYRPLTIEHVFREKRFNFKSVIIIDESSLLANSLCSMKQYNANYKITNEHLTLFLKLIRHELHGAYRNIFGSYANVFVNTQSKNDNHFAFDRCINQVLYITKSLNLPFFKLVWCRDLLLVDSVENNFEDDFKEDKSNRWYLVNKKIFNRYDSYAYSFLTDDKSKIYDISKYIVLSGRFEIVTLLDYVEILNSNKMFYEFVDLKLKELEEKENGQ